MVVVSLLSHICDLLARETQWWTRRTHNATNLVGVEHQTLGFLCRTIVDYVSQRLSIWKMGVMIAFLFGMLFPKHEQDSQSPGGTSLCDKNAGLPVLRELQNLARLKSRWVVSILCNFLVDFQTGSIRRMFLPQKYKCVHLIKTLTCNDTNKM